jgi:hypothetical protein
MHQSEARAWWADVEHVRETIERRRAAERHLRVVPDQPAGPGRARAESDAPATQTDARPETGRRTGTSASARPAAERPAAREPAARRAGDEPGERRTIEITGRTVPAPAVPRVGDPLGPVLGARGAARRPFLSPADRIASRPDRIALWAAVLGFVLIVVAATSS